uniref:Uncharacterized protein n=1 Tax=Anguilla anguilla TaxID=7936 RepID=A0A0E9P5X3_ANGAN
MNKNFVAHRMDKSGVCLIIKCL